MPEGVPLPGFQVRHPVVPKGREKGCEAMGRGFPHHEVPAPLDGLGDEVCGVDPDHGIPRLTTCNRKGDGSDPQAPVLEDHGISGGHGRVEEVPGHEAQGAVPQGGVHHGGHVLCASGADCYVEATAVDGEELASRALGEDVVEEGGVAEYHARIRWAARSTASTMCW